MNTKYTADDISRIADEIMKELVQQEDGFETSTCRLAYAMGYDDMDEPDLFNLHRKLFELADKYDVVLDMSEHEGKFEGLQYNLTFILRKH